MVGLAAGLAVLGVGVRPTGTTVIDAILTVTVSMFVVWAGCSAPWQVLTVGAAAAGAVAVAPIGTGVGIGLVGVSATIGLGRFPRRTLPIISATVVGGVLALLGSARRFTVLGLSAAVGAAFIIVVVVAGMRCRSRTERVLAARITIGGAVVVVAAAVGLAAALSSARDSIVVGETETRAGIEQIRDGELDTAREHFDRAAQAFDEARSAVTAPWTQPARIVPVAAHYRSATANLTSGAEAVSAALVDTLGFIDSDSLRVASGRIDLDSVAALRGPLLSLQSTVDGFAQTIDESQSPWLPATVERDLNSLARDLAEQRGVTTAVLNWIDAAPDLLGADGPRTYFVMFTTPAEARGQGGFMGNYAELTIDDGAITVTALGRPSELNRGLPDDYVLRDVPADWLDRYGAYGFDSAGNGSVVGDAWSIIDLSAHFPYTAQVIAELYPVSGGAELDGVFSLDVYGLAELIGLVGPVKVDGAPRLTRENTADYLLRGQYEGLGNEVSNANRIDVLERVSAVVVARLLTTDPPNLIELAQRFAPLVAERRVLAWSDRDRIESLYQDAGLDGSILADLDRGANADSSVGIQLVVNNGAGNKIDSFLVRNTTYDASRGVVIVDYVNTAPTVGFPQYVIGSSERVDVPVGTSLLLATLYSSVAVDDIKLNGTTVLTAPDTEAGRLAYDFRIELRSGDSARVEIELPDATGVPLVVDQPLVRPPN